MPSYLYELSPGELSSLCRAFAEAAVYNDELTDALCDEVVKRLRSFGAFECLVFLDGLSQIHAGLQPKERRHIHYKGENANKTTLTVAKQS